MIFARVFELLVEGFARFLGLFGYEKLLEREEARNKPDPRNFRPPH